MLSLSNIAGVFGFHWRRSKVQTEFVERDLTDSGQIEESSGLGLPICVVVLVLTALAIGISGSSAVPSSYFP